VVVKITGGLIMARKKVLTQGETKLIDDTVRKFLKEFNPDEHEHFKDDFFNVVYDNVVELYSNGKTKFSEDGLERNVIFNIGYWRGSFEIRGDGFHQGYELGLYGSSLKNKST
jgi:hypothetical protein